MSEKEICALLRTEYERCVHALPGLEPGTEAYHILLQDIPQLQWLCHAEERPDFKEVTPISPIEMGGTSTVTVEEETPSVAVAEESPSGTDWATYRLDLRGALADARSSGVDTTALIKLFGVSKYSEVPNDSLPALRAEMEKALKEKR